MGGGLDSQPAEGHQLPNIAMLVEQNQTMLRTIMQMQQRIDEQQAAFQAGAAAPIAAAPHVGGPARPRMPWPEWDGNLELLPTWKNQVAIKIRNDPLALPDPEGIVNLIYQNLPTTHRARVVGWLSREETRVLGPGEGRWDYMRFLNHIMERCGDPEAAKVAARKLHALRQGRFQPFREFLQEFETLQSKAEAGSEIWPDSVKVRMLEYALNSELSDRMITVRDAPPDNFAGYTAVVSEIASRLEAKESRALVSENNAARKSFFLPTPGSQAAALARRPAATTGVDADGDTVMTGHFLAAFRAGQASRNGHANNRAYNNNAGGNTNRNNLPRAPWRTDDEWQSLRDRGLCTRCLGANHDTRRCPNMRAPIRVARVAAPNAGPTEAVAHTEEGADEEDF